MSKIIEWFLLPLFFVMSIFYAFNSFGSPAVELKKMYHHTTNSDAYIERGNLSLYFSSEPQMKEMDRSNESQSFFFPCVVTSNECEQMIQRVNNYNDGYKITVEKVMAPEQGICITFSCDPKKLALHYEIFDSIGMQRGVVFHLYNKPLIGTLQQKNNQPILRMLSNAKKPCIVIDVGHGGLDSGAIGHGNVYEKSVCLAIGHNVADILRQQGCSVFLTRNNDETVFLDERTLFANKQCADFFISIHANYAGNANCMGIETFCLQQDLFKEKFSTLSLQEKQNVACYARNKIALSHKLAMSIQNYLCGDYCKDENSFNNPINRKVKFSVSQVLLGTQMPSALVEVGFLSHAKEVQLLSCSKYQNFLAQRIASGIVAMLTV